MAAAKRTGCFLGILAACLLCGCRTTPWVRGHVDEGLPKLESRFPQDVAFFVEKTEKRVGRAFREALEARGFSVVEEEGACDVVVKVTVDAWEFNNAGFGGGLGDRDDMELSVQLVDRRRKRILARAKITVRSDFRIISKYVETF